MKAKINAQRTTFTALTVKGLMLFSIFTVLQGVSFFDNINKIWLVIVTLVLCARLITYSYSKVQLSMLIITCILHIVAVLYTDFPLYHTNMLFYFFLWVILYLFFAKSIKKIQQVMASSSQYITGVLWVWTILVGISAFIPSCYRENYFVSFTGTSFRLMPSVLIVEALTIYLINSRDDGRFYFFLVLPCYAAFMSHSRTYFGIYILFLLMFAYMRAKTKKNFYICLIPLSLIMFFVMLNSAITDKFVEVWKEGVSFEEFLSSFTNSRTVFWKWDIDAFLELPFLQQFVGNGFNFVYDVSASYLTHGIWAHNDIINILLNFGYIGVIVYLWAYFQMIKAFWPRGNKIPFAVKALFQSAVFINSMMNMSYTYLCAMISYPLFLCAISARYGDSGLTYGNDSAR